MIDNSIVVAERFDLPAPTETRTQLQAIQAFQAACKQHLQKNLDYGVIPGTQKPTLLKPGAEKIIRLLGLADHYEIVDSTKDWDKPFFEFQVTCSLVHLASGLVVSTGVGECNSMEARYRWRWITDPNTRRRQRVANDDVYTQVNTILKMAKKRALVDAALSAGRLSEIFTQDLEDMRDVIEAERPEPPQQPERVEAEPPPNDEYQQFFAYAKEKGKAPSEALRILGRKSWAEWTLGLDAAKDTLDGTLAAEAEMRR